MVLPTFKAIKSMNFLMAIKYFAQCYVQVEVLNYKHITAKKYIVVLHIVLKVYFKYIEEQFLNNWYNIMPKEEFTETRFPITLVIVEQLVNTKQMKLEILFMIDVKLAFIKLAKAIE